MTDLSKLMQNAALLDVIDKSADEASSLSARNSYQAMRIEELEREADKLRSLWDAEFRRAERAEEELARVRAEYANSIEAWTGINEEKERAEAERDALKQDAERYRWIKTAEDFCTFTYNDSGRVYLDEPGSLDAAIDAARKP